MAPVFKPDLLVAARTSAGVSRERLAADAGVGYATVQRYEVGHAEPTASRLARIAHVLGCSLDAFFGEPS